MRASRPEKAVSGDVGDDRIITSCYWKLLALFLEWVRWTQFHGGLVVIQTDPGPLSWKMDGH